MQSQEMNNNSAKTKKNKKKVNNHNARAIGRKRN